MCFDNLVNLFITREYESYENKALASNGFEYIPSEGGHDGIHYENNVLHKLYLRTKGEQSGAKKRGSTIGLEPLAATVYLYIHPLECIHISRIFSFIIHDGMLAAVPSPRGRDLTGKTLFPKRSEPILMILSSRLVSIRCVIELGTDRKRN